MPRRRTGLPAASSLRRPKRVSFLGPLFLRLVKVGIGGPFLERALYRHIIVGKRATESASGRLPQGCAYLKRTLPITFICNVVSPGSNEGSATAAAGAGALMA